MTKLTVIDMANGQTLVSGASRAEAARELLLHDGGDYEIRQSKGGGWQLFVRNQTAGKPWSPTLIFSHAETADTAETEILENFLRRDHLPRFDVMTDDEFSDVEASMLIDAASDRTINGRSIERAEVFDECGFWRWRVIDACGTEYVDGGNFRTRPAAAKSLDAALDPA